MTSLRHYPNKDQLACHQNEIFSFILCGKCPFMYLKRSQCRLYLNLTNIQTLMQANNVNASFIHFLITVCFLNMSLILYGWFIMADAYLLILKSQTLFLVMLLSGYMLEAQDVMCVDRCPLGFFGNSSSLICERCSANCEACESRDECVSCNTASYQLYLFQGSCYSNCPEWVLLSYISIL